MRIGVNLRRSLGAILTIGGALFAVDARACTFDYTPPLEVRYSGVRPGSAEERRLDRHRARMMYRTARSEAIIGGNGDTAELAQFVANWLVPPVVAGPDRAVGCGGARGDVDAAGYRPVDSFEAEFETKIGTSVVWSYGHPTLYAFQQFLAIPHSCNAEFRAAVARALAARATSFDIAAVRFEIAAHETGGWSFNGDAMTSPARLMRFSEGRVGALMPHLEEPPAGSLGRWESIRSILSEHRQALSDFLGENDAARRVTRTLEGIVAEVQAQPGGDERYCPAAIAERDRIIDQTRTAETEASEG